MPEKRDIFKGYEPPDDLAEGLQTGRGITAVYHWHAYSWLREHRPDLSEDKAHRYADMLYCEPREQEED